MAEQPSETGKEDAIAINSPDSLPRSSYLPAKRKFDDSEERIVWPPVVIIENTLTHYDAQQKKWRGLENEEVRAFLKGFKDIQFGRVCALYGKYETNMGKSLVIFPSTPSGYMDAQTLSEILDRDQRGRRHWLNVRGVRDPFGPGKATPDGKKILYGYLASQRDMEQIPQSRKIVKRWSMESYKEKVLQPLNQCERDKEEARKKRVELIEEAKQKQRSIEQNKVEVDKAAAEVRKINEEIEAQKKHEEELEAMHRKTFEERRRKYEQEKLHKLESFKERERSIRQQLRQNNIAKQEAVTKFKQLAQRLKDGIDLEKKKHELRNAEQQQLEMLDRMKLDSLLQSEMEEKLAMLEKKFQDKQLELQEKHNQQIMKSRENLAAEREEFLEEKLQELKRIEKESEEAKTATMATQNEIERECIICFCDIASEKLERALFDSCKHANMCSECATTCWKEATKKKERLKCPTCNTVQYKKFTLIPAKIYT